MEIGMSFKDSYPEYAAIEEHIRRAHLERSVAIAHFLADVAVGTIGGLKRLARALNEARRGHAIPAWARQPSAR
jgi:hypothetical protein